MKNSKYIETHSKKLDNMFMNILNIKGQWTFVLNQFHEIFAEHFCRWYQWKHHGADWFIKMIPDVIELWIHTNMVATGEFSST